MSVLPEISDIQDELKIIMFHSDYCSMPPIVEQAIEELEQARIQLPFLRKALVASYDVHKRTECTSADNEECTCTAFEIVRAALALSGNF